jgi:hypothetical protein
MGNCSATAANRIKGENRVKHQEIKAIITGLIWFSYLGMVWFTIPLLSNWAVLLAFVMTFPLVAAMGFMWSATTEGQASNPDSAENEKRKRERLDSVLRDLSDEDLLRLKERLMNGSINAVSLEEALIGEDGELLRERR